jgi:hypothetical protein
LQRIALCALFALGAVVAAWLLLAGRGDEERSRREAARREAVSDATHPQLESVGGHPRSATARAHEPAPPPATGRLEHVSEVGPFAPRAQRPSTMKLLGRLLEADGTVAAGARLGACPRTGDTSTVIPLLASAGLTDAAGRFAISVEQCAELELWAWSPRSAPTVLPRSVGAGSEHVLGDIVLPEGLVIEGRLLLGGRPSTHGAARLNVSRAGGGGGFGLAGNGRTFMVDEEGRPYSTGVVVTTEDDGSWRAAGLSPGRYTVFIAAIGEAGLHPALYAGPSLAREAPAHDVVIDLDASLLIVERRANERARLPRHLQVVLDAGGEDGAARAGLGTVPVPERAHTQSWWASEDRAWVPASSPLEVWVQDSGFDGWHERLVSAAAGGTRRVVPASPVTAYGWIKVRRPVDARSLPADLRVRLFVSGTNRLVHEQRAHLAAVADVAAIHAPRGTWTAELTAVDAPQGADAELMLPQRETVDVGATLEGAPLIAWSPPRGGRLSLLVEGAPQAPARVRCVVRRGDSEQDGLLFRRLLDIPGLDRASAYLFPEPLVTGQRMESAWPLEPGGVTLRLECEGFEAHEEPAVIRAGETTDVTVRLVQR